MLKMKYTAVSKNAKQILQLSPDVVNGTSTWTNTNALISALSLSVKCFSALLPLGVFYAITVKYTR
jgi:hypothetical protein